ncbi:aldose 1-epimerase family protein [Enterococcus sp. AZ103]|uniref:aldose 1-epimerase family protein n=1 Tax=Enterococcus sp. AZ103 TaxID=2774628 RepID=UPI003F1F203C
MRAINYTIKNQYLTAEIATKGGLLRSLKNQAGIECIWQRDPNFWEENDVNIFPYIARLTNETFVYQNKDYHLPIHGFLWTSELEVVTQTDECLILSLKSTQETKKQFPFDFELKIYRRLAGESLETTYEVNNLSQETMYFGIGGHPAFNVPLQPGLTFEDYYVQFEQSTIPEKVAMSVDGFVEEGDELFQDLDHQHKLVLHHQLFDQDAIILKNAGNKVQLKTDKDSVGLEIEFGDFDYLGLWHMPKLKAPYLCVEPWSSLPSRKNIIENIAEQENLISLPTNSSYQSTWKIKLL